jgi:hypothetical protein
VTGPFSSSLAADELPHFLLDLPLKSSQNLSLLLCLYFLLALFKRKEKKITFDSSFIVKHSRKRI